VTQPIEQSVADIPMPLGPAPDKPIIAIPIPSLPPLELSALMAEPKNNGSPFKGNEEGEIIDQAEVSSIKEDSASSSIVSPREQSSDSKPLSKDAALARDQFKHNVRVCIKSLGLCLDYHNSTLLL